MSEIIHEIEGNILLISQKQDETGKPTRYGIRLDDKDYKFQWFNGTGQCPYKMGEFVKIKVLHNEGFYNIVDLVGADQLGKSVDNIEPEFIDLSKRRVPEEDINTKLQRETNRCNLMCKAVELAIHWKSENTKAIKAIYYELLDISNQEEYDTRN